MDCSLFPSLRLYLLVGLAFVSLDGLVYGMGPMRGFGSLKDKRKLAFRL